MVKAEKTNVRVVISHGVRFSPCLCEPVQKRGKVQWGDTVTG